MFWRLRCVCVCVSLCACFFLFLCFFLYSLPCSLDVMSALELHCVDDVCNRIALCLLYRIEEGLLYVMVVFLEELWCVCVCPNPLQKVLKGGGW